MMSRPFDKDPAFLRYPPDPIDREVLIDVYPRKHDYYRSGVTLGAPDGTLPGGPDMPPLPGADIFKNAITMPGVRPVAYQRALSLSLPVTDTPTPIQAGTFQCYAIEISVPSSSANSTFFGFGSSVSSSSGIEIKPGFPQLYSPDNVREQWELQRMLEAIAAMLGYMIQLQTGIDPAVALGTFMSPRV